MSHDHDIEQIFSSISVLSQWVEVIKKHSLEELKQNPIPLSDYEQINHLADSIRDASIERKKNEEKMKYLAELFESLGGMTDTHSIIKQTYKSLTEFLNCSDSALYFLDLGTYVPAQEAFMETLNMPLRSEAIQTLFADHQDISVYNGLKVDSFLYNYFIKAGDELEGAHFLFMRIRGTGAAYCFFQSPGSKGFDSSDLEFCKVILSQMTLLIKNIFQFEHEIENLEIKVEERTFELMQAVNEITLLNDVARKVNSTLDIEQVLDKVAQAVRDVLKFDGMMVQVVEPETRLIKIEYVRGTIFTPENLKRYRAIIIHRDEADSLADYVIQMNQPFYVPEITKDVLVYPADHQIYDIQPYVSMLLLPLNVMNETVGCIGFYCTTQPFHISQTEIERVGRFVMQVASAIYNARMYEELKHTRNQLAITEKLKMVLESIRSIHNIRDKFALLLASCQIMIRKTSIEASHIRFYFQERMSNGQQGYACFEFAIEPDTSPVIQLETLRDLKHTFYQTMPQLEGLAADVDFSNGCFGVQHHFFIPVMHQHERTALIELLDWNHEELSYEDKYFVDTLAATLQGILENLGFLLELEEQVHARTLELKQAMIQIVQYEKMATLGTMVAGIAHEINSPASAVDSGARELDRDYLRLLESMIQLLQKLEPGLWDLFINTCKQVLVYQDEVTTAEQRTRARTLQPMIQYLNFASARNAAQDLAMAGFTEATLPEIMPLLESAWKEEIRKILSQLVFSRIHLRDIKLGIERIIQIVKAFRSYSRLDSAQQADTNLSEELDNTLIILRHKWKMGITIHREYAAVPPYRCYADQLNQVWTNLIHNAIQAINGKGDLWIRLYQHVGADTAHTNLETAHASWLIVEIEDNGPGIPPDVKNRLFDKFFTTKPKGQGSGLGLSIAKEIVERHQGKIEVESTPGKTCFRVLLPKRDPATKNTKEH
ncbi:MAG: GAF domain-containing protein [SAR324 cluster bacterium]|nr:GAF domain-containing protein [SAR324 cluster bacterium]